MKTSSRALLLLLAPLSFDGIANSQILTTRPGTISDVGDWLQILTPGAGLGLSLYQKDYDGALMLTKGVATTAAITHSLKFSVGRLRPNANSNVSFPSGHTSAAFSGAAFIDHRYDNWWKYPAYFSAAFVGYSRVWANQHYMDDVLAGASIGTLTSLYFTQQKTEQLAVYPSVQDGASMINLTYQPEGSAAPSKLRHNRNKKHEYELNFGAANPIDNHINSDGSLIDLAGLAKDEAPYTFASANYRYRHNRHHQWVVNFTPFETRTYAQLNDSVTFNGRWYQNGDTLISSHRIWSLYADWQYTLASQGGLAWFAGLGGYLQYLETQLDNIQGSAYQREQHIKAKPSINSRIVYRLNSRFSLTTELRGSKLSGDDMLELSASANWHLSDIWRTGLFIGNYRHNVQADGYTNRVNYNYAGIKVAYAF